MHRLYFAAILATLVACNVSDKDRCSEGREWSSQFGGCVDPVGSAGRPNASDGGTDSGGAGQAGTESVAGGSGVAGSGNIAGAGNASPTPNLGATCTSDADCANGSARSCLLNSQAPSQPGICTILNCDASACGEAFDCCDCTQSPMLGSTWPSPKCIPTSSTPTMTALSCTCS